jgi:hypothetical protein
MANVIVAASTTRRRNTGRNREKKHREKEQGKGESLPMGLIGLWHC